MHGTADATAPVRLLNVLQLRPDRLQEAEQLLVTLQERANDDPNCRRFELLRELSNPARVVIQIDFADVGHLQAFLDADWRQELLRGVLDLLDGENLRLMLALVPAALPSGS